jgi:hypothetical protein
MRRLFLTAILVVLVAAPIANAASPATRTRTATGEIKSLTLTRIVVGRLSCALGAKATSAARFVIGDPVTIACRNGRLLTVRYAPQRGAGTTSRTAGATAVVAPGSDSTARGPAPGDCVTYPNGVIRCFLGSTGG